MLRGLWRGRNCFVLSNPSPRDGNMVTNILSSDAICGQITPHLASWGGKLEKYSVFMFCVVVCSSAGAAVTFLQQIIWAQHNTYTPHCYFNTDAPQLKYTGCLITLPTNEREV